MLISTTRALELFHLIKTKARMPRLRLNLRPPVYRVNALTITLSMYLISEIMIV